MQRFLLPFVVVIALAGVGCGSSGEHRSGSVITTAPTSTEPASTAAGFTVPTAPPVALGGTVTVTITDVVGAKGSRLAVIMHRAGHRGDGLGGFAVPVSTDSFSVTGTIRQASPLWWSRPWGPEAASATPPVSPVATIPSGTHTLAVFVSSKLAPYTNWVPAVPVELGCEVAVTVADGQATRVELSGVPPWDGRNVARCPVK